jgi:hypothetical protein
MLDPSNLAHYLIGRALIGPGDVVGADLKIVDVSRRNRNFIVHRNAGASYLIKQGVDRTTVESIANETRVYRSLESAPARAGALRGFRRFCPRLIDFDEGEGVLVLELFPDATNLHDHYLRCGRFAARTARALGEALGALHSLPVCEDAPKIVPESGLTSPARTSPAWPWVFSLHQPDLSMFCEISQANLDLIRILQNDAAFCDGIAALIDGWKAEALIHSDLRWENCLIVERTRLKIIDWELAGPGDPCWDVGSVLAAYLGFWLQFLPVTATSPSESFVQGTRYPLAAMRPAVAAFWHAYVQTRQLATAAARHCLVQSIRFSAVRLVQGAFEWMQDAGELTGTAVCALQLSRNMLVEPEAAGGLLGLGDEIGLTDPNMY